jgi:hypothetical protein
VGCGIGGVGLTYGDGATMQAYHSYMQELFVEHTAFEADATLGLNVWER